MGTERRAPTAAELDEDAGARREGDADGAVGFSTGLQYVPGTYADQAEIVALAKAAGRNRRRLRHAHAQRRHRARSGREGGARRSARPRACPVEISHLKVDAPSRWGASAKALAMIDAARARGMQRRRRRLSLRRGELRRSASASRRGRSKAARTQINERLDDAATWRRIKEEMKKLIRERGLENYSFARIASYRSDPSLNGLSIPDAAAQAARRRTISTRSSR